MIKSLPHLPLDEQTSHITQDMVDRILDYLVEHYPGCIEKMSMYEKGYTDASTLMAYAEAMQSVITEISKVMDTPECDLGYIELNFELVRRYRAACGYEFPKVLGKPLAPSIEGPYPENLPEKPIFDQSILKAGFTQEQVDSWGNEFYKENKEICYQMAESYRREVATGYLGTRNPISVYFRQKAETTKNDSLIRHYSMALNELGSRIRLACEIHSLDEFQALAEIRNKAAEVGRNP